jgi:hypothetical protein
MVNQLIRELALQAGAGEWGNSVIPAMTDIEKFADLIVQECINTVQKRYMGDNNREDMEVLRCVSELKNHFGICEVQQCKT